MIEIHWSVLVMACVLSMLLGFFSFAIFYLAKTRERAMSKKEEIEETMRRR